MLSLNECREIYSKENSIDPTSKNVCTINPVGKGACMGDSGITISKNKNNSSFEFNRILFFIQVAH